MAVNFPSSLDSNTTLYLVSNNLAAVLNNGGTLSSGATTITVVSTTGFPTSGFITIDSEAISYTGTTGTTFTGCVRGADGTTAATHVDGSQVKQNAVAAHHNQLKDAVIAIETLLGTTVTSAEYGRLSGVTSAIQTQINTKAPTASPTFTGVSLFANGASGSPSIAFASDTGTGFYRAGASDIILQTGGVDRVEMSTTKMISSLLFLAPNGTVGNPAFTFGSDQTTGMFRIGSANIGFATGGTQAMSIDSSESVIVGTGSTRTVNGVNSLFQVEGTAASARPSFTLNLNTAAGMLLQLGKSRGGSNGSSTIVNNGDFVGGIYMMAANGVDMSACCAYILSSINGTPSATSMPGQLDLATTPVGSIAPTVALSIKPDQSVNVINKNGLQIGGNQSYPIVQIVTGTSTTAFSTTSSTFQTTNLSVSITPKFSTSKIYIIATGSMGDSSTSKVVQATIARGGTNVLGTGGGVAWNVSIAGTLPVMIQAYDSPASTSAQTYAVQVRNFDNVSTVNFGAGTSPEITQYITAIEIAQ